MIEITARQFFRPDPLQRAAQRAKRRVLSRAGAYVRQTARRSLKPYQSPARPGDPPRSRTGLLKRFIYFGLMPDGHTVVIGPARLGRTQMHGSITTPQLLEHGGPRKLNPRKQTPRKSAPGGAPIVHHRAYPYMGPALDKEAPNFPQLFRGEVR
jgi:hypothetical protein